MKKVKYIILVMFVLLLTGTSYCQVYNKQNSKYRSWQKSQHFKKKYRYWMFGASLGSMNYKGDLNPKANAISTEPKSTRWNVGAHLVYRYAPRVSFRGSLSMGRIYGSDELSANPYGDVYSEGARYTRNLSFSNNIIELKSDVVVDWFQNRKSMRRRVNWTPYGFAGVAMFYNNPKAKYDGVTYSLRKLGTEGQLLSGGKAYSAIQVAIPYGFGVRFKINNAIDIAWEFGARFTLTDYLDDVSSFYVDKSKLGAPDDIAVILSDRSVEKPMHPNIQEQVGDLQYTGEDGYNYTRSYEAGDPRGNSANNDWYFVTGIHLTYIFHPKVYAARYKG